MNHEARTHKEDLSLGELFTDLSTETSTLIHQEMQLAQSEMAQKAARIGKQSVLLITGGALAYAGLLALIAALVLGIAATGLAPWASALIVGVLVASLGCFCILKGLQTLQHTYLVPQQTVETLKEDLKWAKDQTR